MENKWWLAFFAEIKYPAADLTACPDQSGAVSPGQQAGYKIVGPCPVMNVPVKQLYLSLITTFPLFIPVRGLQTRRYLKHCLSLDQLLPSALCLSRVLTLTQTCKKSNHLLVALCLVYKYCFSKDLFPSKYSSLSDRTSYFKPRTFFQSLKKKTYLELVRKRKIFPNQNISVAALRNKQSKQ